MASISKFGIAVLRSLGSDQTILVETDRVGELRMLNGSMEWQRLYQFYSLSCHEILCIGDQRGDTPKDCNWI